MSEGQENQRFRDGTALGLMLIVPAGRVRKAVPPVWFRFGRSGWEVWEVWKVWEVVACIPYLIVCRSRRGCTEVQARR